jgi:hypothetical protein
MGFHGVKKRIGQSGIFLFLQGIKDEVREKVMNGNVWTRLLVAALFTAAGACELYAQQGESLLIGGWGFAESGYAQKNRVNYARVVYEPTESNARNICSKKFHTTVNLKAKSTGQLLAKDEFLAGVREWANLSTRYRCIAELAQDDFGRWWQKYYKKDRGIILAVKDAIKKGNPNLQYGATLYEDDLTRLTADELNFLGKNVDVVHFYLHKRDRLNNYGQYIQKIKYHFPSAKIIFGVYRTDRREYERRLKSSEKEEMDLFMKQLEVCFAMVKRKAADGIEFYPGSLGNDDGVLRGRSMQENEEKAFLFMSRKINEQLFQKGF